MKPCVFPWKADWGKGKGMETYDTCAPLPKYPEKLICAIQTRKDGQLAVSDNFSLADFSGHFGSMYIEH